MNNNNELTNNYVRLGIRTTVLTFMISVSLYLLYYVFKHEYILIFTLVYIIFGGIINLAVLLFLLVQCLHDYKSEGYLKLLGTSFIMLLNIPVSLIQIYLTF